MDTGPPTSHPRHLWASMKQGNGAGRPETQEGTQEVPLAPTGGAVDRLEIPIALMGQGGGGALRDGCEGAWPLSGKPVGDV